MTRHLNTLCLLALSLGISPRALNAQSRQTMPILELNADVRSFAMGQTIGGESVGMHIYSNPTSVLHNPMLKRLHTSYTLMLMPSQTQGAKAQYHALTVGGKLSQRDGLSLGLRALHTLGLDATKSSQQSPNEPIRQTDLTWDVAYSRRWSGAFSTFIIGSVLRSSRAQVGYAYSASLGLSYRGAYRLGGNTARYTLGLSLHHLGTNLHYKGQADAYNLPRYANLGASSTYAWAKRHRLSLAASLRYYFPEGSGSELRAGIGAEYMLDTRYMLRGGYHQSALGGQFTCGAGWRLGAVALNASYAFNPDVTHNALNLGVNINF